MPETPQTEQSERRVAPRQERRSRSAPRGTGRPAVAKYLARFRLWDFHRTLSGLALAAFGPDATVVPHLRRVRGIPRLTFVVDAADPSATVRYQEFLPREQAFWTAYTQLPKPSEVPFMVAIRPARGWSRAEALAPFFSILPPPQFYT
jgi:hypothetical protein